MVFSTCIVAQARSDEGSPHEQVLGGIFVIVVLLVSFCDIVLSLVLFFNIVSFFVVFIVTLDSISFSIAWFIIFPLEFISSLYVQLDLTNPILFL